MRRGRGHAGGLPVVRSHPRRPVHVRLVAAVGAHQPQPLRTAADERDPAAVWRPHRLQVRAGVRDRRGAASVGVHDDDLAGARGRPLECDPAAVGAPIGKQVVARRRRQLRLAASGRGHRPQRVIRGGGIPPREDDRAAVRRPGGIGVAAHGHLREPAAVRVDGGDAAVVGCHLRPVRRPARHLRAAGDGDGLAAVGAHHQQLVVCVGEHNPRAVGRERWPAVTVGGAQHLEAAAVRVDGGQVAAPVDEQDAAVRAGERCRRRLCARHARCGGKGEDEHRQRRAPQPLRG